jgi:mRNA interferase RelE/StbE
MNPYKIIFDKGVAKDLSKIPRNETDRILKKIDLLASEPHPPQSLKISGMEAVYRLRVGNYRVIYRIDKHLKEVTVYHIRDRKDVYRWFK